MFEHFAALAVEEGEDRLVIRMNRPEVRNAIDATMVAELHEVCAYLEVTPKILILTGCEVDGRGIFASGADIAQLRERRREDALRGVNSQIFDRIHKLPMPVIAAIDGYALGGGAELAYAADFRLGTPRPEPSGVSKSWWVSRWPWRFSWLVVFCLPTKRSSCTW